MVAALRIAGIRAELYLGNPKHGVGQQLKYADRRGAPCAIIQGGDEKAKGEVQIKDLIAGAGLTAIKDRDEALAELVVRYFMSHGPATARDFSWWSGFTISDTNKAIAAAGRQLERRHAQLKTEQRAVHVLVGFVDRA